MGTLLNTKLPGRLIQCTRFAGVVTRRPLSIPTHCDPLRTPAKKSKGRHVARIVCCGGSKQTSVMGKLKRTTVPLVSSKGPPASRFKVLQWNILADGLAQHGDFVKVPPEVLEWEYRLPLVLEEILEAGADIICFQELNHYADLLVQLQKLGYDGVFLAKHCSPAERYKCPADGLAIFHNTRRFQRIGEPTVHTYVDDDGQKQSQGFLQVRLHDQSVGQDLVVVTTHLKAKEGAKEDEVRLKQMQQLLTRLDGTLFSSAVPHPSQAIGNGNGSSSAFSRNGNGTATHGSNGNGNGKPLPDSYNATGSSHMGSSNGKSHPSGLVPVIITGDFNATPESSACQELKAHPAGFKSMWDVPACQLTTTALFDAPTTSAAVANGCNQASAGAGAAAVASALAAATAAADAAESHLAEFSTWKFRSKGESKRIIDHMWFTVGRSLRPISRWRMLTEQEIGPCALPSCNYASDHTSLCCEFEWDFSGPGTNVPYADWYCIAEQDDWGSNG